MNQQQDQERTTGLYVDIENLNYSGQELLQNLLQDWPRHFPEPTLLRLYTRANQVEMWRLWASHEFPSLQVYASGTQNFSQNSTKNSADIAMSVQAMADLLQKRVTHIAVFSNDSDFISLYHTIVQEPEIDTPKGIAPFLWVITDRPNPISAMLRRFFPEAQRHILPLTTSSNGLELKPLPPEGDPCWEQAAHLIIANIPPGSFRSGDCQPIIRQQQPDHPLAQLGSAEFGHHMASRIWPIMEKLGRRQERPQLPHDHTRQGEQHPQRSRTTRPSGMLESGYDQNEEMPIPGQRTQPSYGRHHHPARAVQPHGNHRDLHPRMPPPTPAQDHTSSQ